MVSRVIPVEPFDLVVIGATGDLARRKILPALCRRFCAGQMPPEARVIGVARHPMSDAEFRALAREAIEAHSGGDGCAPADVAGFIDRLAYVALDAGGAAAADGWAALSRVLRPDVIRAVYFSVGPDLFAPLAEGLRDQALVTPATRIVVEKPFGHDLGSARALNAVLASAFDEHQIFRIDHYLGKETVQNLMALRFANVLFEPVWNAQFVDHVQITVAESLGVEGRAAYYETAGAMRDMVQNHLMQLLCLTAMAPPSRFEADAVRDEKLKVIRALDPVEPGNAVRGQYRAAAGMPGYAEEAGAAQSATESFVALKVHVSNWRWAGTPFYLRTGKRLAARLSEIAVVFKDPPHSIFGADGRRRGNELAIRLQPDEGITMRVTIKEPGPGGLRLVEVPLDMTFAEALGARGAAMPDAYERLIMDVVRGNQTLFMRGDEVEAAWAWTDPVVAGWQAQGEAPHPYPAGSGGPEEALALMHRDGRRWRALEG